MNKARCGRVLKPFTTSVPSVVLSDGELLDLFTSRADETAELAFQALVVRYGAMVLRVCRSQLRDEHDSENAFQATFL